MDFEFKKALKIIGLAQMENYSTFNSFHKLFTIS